MRLSINIAATVALAAFQLAALSQCAAQTANASFGTAADNPAPRVELFLGYSYLRSVPSQTDTNRLMDLNGGSSSIAFNVNRYFGLVGDFGGFNDTQLQLTGTGGNPTTTANSSGTVYTYLGGPRLSFRKSDRVTPFVQALFGGVHASEVALSNCPAAPCTELPSENSFAMTAGVGLDVKIHRHLAIRVIQAEYLMTRFDSLTTGAKAMQNDMRLSSGIVFRFGGHAAMPMPTPSPLSYSCTVYPLSVFPGDSIAVTGSALNLWSGKPATYTWSVDGGTVSGNSFNARIDTTKLSPGSYTITGHVSQGEKPNESAICTASYVVKAIALPTVSCTANPQSVTSGDSSTISATAINPANRPLTYAYSATSGSVSGAGSTATLSTAGAMIGSVTVTCSITDDKDQSASATTTVTVTSPPLPPKPQTRELCGIQFERDARRPARVDNEAKACLDEIALDLQQNADSRIAIIGNAGGDEKSSKKLAKDRAVNAKAYLVSDKGVDASRISIYIGSQDSKSVSTTLIPVGATFDTTGSTSADVP